MLTNYTNAPERWIIEAARTPRKFAVFAQPDVSFITFTRFRRVLYSAFAILLLPIRGILTSLK